MLLHLRHAQTGISKLEYCQMLSLHVSFIRSNLLRNVNNSRLRESIITAHIVSLSSFMLLERIIRGIKTRVGSLHTSLVNPTYSSADLWGVFYREQPPFRIVATTLILILVWVEFRTLLHASNYRHAMQGYTALWLRAVPLLRSASSDGGTFPIGAHKPIYPPLSLFVITPNFIHIAAVCFSVTIFKCSICRLQYPSIVGLLRVDIK